MTSRPVLMIQTCSPVSCHSFSKQFPSPGLPSQKQGLWEDFRSSYSVRIVDNGVDCLLIELWDPILVKLLLKTALSDCSNCCLEKSDLFLTLPSSRALSLMSLNDIAAEPSISGLKGVNNLLFTPAPPHPMDAQRFRTTALQHI